MFGSMYRTDLRLLAESIEMEQYSRSVLEVGRKRGGGTQRIRDDETTQVRSVDGFIDVFF